MAMDESRKLFPLTRLCAKDGSHDDRLVEAWFRGVHSDIGGGNGNRGLNWIALHWMFMNAVRTGLPIPRTRSKRTCRTADCRDRSATTNSIWSWSGGTSPTMPCTRVSCSDRASAAGRTTIRKSFSRESTTRGSSPLRSFSAPGRRSSPRAGAAPSRSDPGTPCRLRRPSPGSGSCRCAHRPLDRALGTQQHVVRVDDLPVGRHEPSQALIAHRREDRFIARHRQRRRHRTASIGGGESIVTGTIWWSGMSSTLRLATAPAIVGGSNAYGDHRRRGSLISLA